MSVKYQSITLADTMKRLDISCKEMSVDINMSLSTVTAARNTHVSYGTARAICRYLNMAFEQVFDQV
jgi:DNA-binding XRE family transcriptional regulator